MMLSLLFRVRDLRGAFGRITSSGPMWSDLSHSEHCQFGLYGRSSADSALVQQYFAVLLSLGAEDSAGVVPLALGDEVLQRESDAHLEGVGRWDWYWQGALNWAC
uniref:(northern house mosquito) hypothetical protein n=1 Tax=Culex pipiens TaxID=7175 RepID=A0A8D8DX77_CULPI